MTVRILTGDCREVLKTLPDESVHCVVSSPPYFGLRSYGIGTENGEIGLEPTPDAFVAEMVAVFREVRRVLRKDGTCWLNLGDSYAAGGMSGPHKGLAAAAERSDGNPRERSGARAAYDTKISRTVPVGLKAKDLIGIPWMVAFALRADGWYLRQDIIWSKPNPMPESVRDRCTKAHEYLFLLAKSSAYYYNSDAIKVDASPSSFARWAQDIDAQKGSDRAHDGAKTNGAMKAVGGVTRRRPNGAPTQEHIPGGNTCGVPEGGVNKRSVWTVATQPFSEAHFATFPPDLIEPCIKAGTSEKGCCPSCGAPWDRTTAAGYQSDDRPQMRRARELFAQHNLTDKHLEAIRAVGITDAGKAQTTQAGFGKNDPEMQRLADEAKSALRGYYREFLISRPTTTGWAPSCACPAQQLVPCTVLDPFGGAGTTALVADRLQRNAILIELNPEYARLALERLRKDGGMFSGVEMSSGGARSPSTPPSSGKSGTASEGCRERVTLNIGEG